MNQNEIWVGIVGSEQAKFDSITENSARQLIQTLLKQFSGGVSGACHLGGIDIFAKEEAKKLNIPFIEYPPEFYNWEDGYKPRNIKIARHSHEVYCITVKELPDNYVGMKFTHCYHCNTNSHVKSGGCWTVHYAKKLKKKVGIYVINPDGSVSIEL